MNTEEGLALSILLLLRVQVGGLVVLGDQCSSWAWLARSSTKRAAANPSGDTSRRCVAEGNELNDRTALLCTLARLIGVCWLVEQPASSLFFATKSMATAIAATAAWRVHL